MFPALATGCTMVLKPPQLAPYSAQILAEILDAAGVPAGVYNMVYGDGPGVGAALSTHPDVDMMSFTGCDPGRRRRSQKNAADTVKRVDPGTRRQEPATSCSTTTAFAKSVAAGTVGDDDEHSGQTCNAPSRMLVPNVPDGRGDRGRPGAAEAVTVGDPGEQDRDRARSCRGRSSTRSRG